MAGRCSGADGMVVRAAGAWLGCVSGAVGEAASGRAAGARSGCNGENIPVAVGRPLCWITIRELARGSLLGREAGDGLGR